MIRLVLYIAAFIFVINLVCNPVGTAAYLGDVIHAFKQAIETGLK